MPRFKQQTQLDRGGVLNGNYGGELLVKNWPYLSGPFSNSGRAIVWDDSQRLWYSFGSDGTNTPILVSANGHNWLLPVTGSIPNFIVDVMSAAKVPNQNMILVGGDPAGSSSNKVFYSNDRGVSWNVPSGGVGAADSETIRNIAYGASPLAYIAMGSASGHIYRSTNGTSGWSLVFTAGGSPTPMFKGLVMANNLSQPLALACYLGTTTYYSSVNGTSWITRTFPANPSGVSYSSTLKKWFMVTGSAAGVYVSSSGVGGWTLVPTTANLSVIRAFGSLLLGVGTANNEFNQSGVCYSADQGQTWRPVLTTNLIGNTIAVAQQHSSLFNSAGASEPIIEPHQALFVTGAPSATYYASLKGT